MTIEKFAANDHGHMLVPKGTVVISVNTAWNIVNFRAGLVKALCAEGYRVIAATPEDGYSLRVRELGCVFHSLPMDNGGTSPLRDVMLLATYLVLFWKTRPSIFLSYTAKPNIYGSLAARIFGIPVINNIAGLGIAYVHGGWLMKVVSRLYRIALSKSHTVFFQNEEDQQQFLNAGLVDALRCERLPGSGVDTRRFTPRVGETSSRPFTFLLSGRLLWEKGIGEFVEAARRIRRRRADVQFVVQGFADVSNPSSISRAELEVWNNEGVIHYAGATDDMVSSYAAADCVVLPSYYREGVPRTLLEAASMAIPVITCDMPGCRDAVEDGVTGFLCKPRDVEDLAAKMYCVLDMSEDARHTMGWCGRAKMMREFDEVLVVRRYLEVIKKAVKQ